MSKNLIDWSEKYSVGYDIIDNQHKKLIETLNKLNNLFLEDNENNALENLLKEILEYTNYHFKTEEECFKKYDYSDSERHIAQHNEFKKQANKFYQEQNIYDIIDFLKTWLTSHMQVADKRYGFEFKNKGVIITE